MKINIVDTPGHADFGGEVERALKMADGALLLVDAAEGPLPQTRFVLSKALELGLPADRRHQQDRPPRRAGPMRCSNEVFDLFCELEAPTTSSSTSRPSTPSAATASPSGDLEDEAQGPRRRSSRPSWSACRPPQRRPRRAALRCSSTTSSYDDYVGRLAIGRIVARQASPPAATVALMRDDGTKRVKVGNVYGFDGLKQVEVGRGVRRRHLLHRRASRTCTSATRSPIPRTPCALPRINVDEPTLKMTSTSTPRPSPARAAST